MSRDEGFLIKRRSTKGLTEQDHQMSTEPRWQSITDLSLSRRRSNELQKGGMTMSKMCPTYRQLHKPTGRKSTETRTKKPTENSTSQGLLTSQNSTGMQSTETRTEKSTDKSTQKSSKSILKPPIMSYYEVDQMVTEADFE
jgi:hypothetical protein